MDSKLRGIVYVLTIVSLLGDLSKVLVDAKPQVPCLFFFGDSLFDNGNNNLLNTTAKVNYKPYGIDFPGGPTGRFSNGRNIADYIAHHLGFSSYITPFATANDQDLLTGVNYASGGSGILDVTGSHLGDRISLNKQLSNHRSSISRMQSTLPGGEAAVSARLRKCIYAVNMGSNDYINNYLLPQYYNSSTFLTPQQYAEVLIENYSLQIRSLYNAGARKVALFGLGLIGCTPAERAIAHEDDCVESINENVQLFNYMLISLVIDLNNAFSDANFIFIDVTEITTVDLGIIRLSITNDPCCPVSTTDVGRGQCLRNRAPCLLRDLVAFYDGFHPSEIASRLIASGSYHALLPLYAYPFGIRHLASL